MSPFRFHVGNPPHRAKSPFFNFSSPEPTRNSDVIIIEKSPFTLNISICPQGIHSVAFFMTGTIFTKNILSCPEISTFIG